MLGDKRGRPSRRDPVEQFLKAMAEAQGKAGAGFPAPARGMDCASREGARTRGTGHRAGAQGEGDETFETAAKAARAFLEEQGHDFGIILDEELTLTDSSPLEDGGWRLVYSNHQGRRRYLTVDVSRQGRVLRVARWREP